MSTTREKQHPKKNDYITVDNTDFISTKNIIEGWHLYFERQAEPKQDLRFIATYEDQVLEDLNIIEDI